MQFDRLDTLLKQQGKTKKHMCDLVGQSVYYLRNCKAQGTRIPTESVRIWADDLGTTSEYLLGLTDNPFPTSQRLADEAEDGKEKLLHLLMGKLPNMSEEAEAALEKLLSLSDEDFDRTVKAVGALIG